MESVGAGSEYVSNGTDPSILRGRANPEPQSDCEMLVELKQILAKHIKYDKKQKAEMMVGINLSHQFHMDQ